MKRFLISLPVLGICLVVGITAFIFFNSRPVSPDQSQKEFVVNKGDGLFEISRRLQQNHLIRHHLVFVLFAYRFNLQQKLQAGTFRLSPSLSSPQVVVKLSRGGSQDYWFRIIEGTRREEISQDIPPTSPIIPSEFLNATIGLEGQLFPDSYLLPQDFNINQTLDLIRQHFQEKLNLAHLDPTSELPVDQTLILASLLEREARSLGSKQMIAGILQQRLKLGMALQVDATVQYARDSSTPHYKNKNYWNPISKPDLKINSPFNTYLRPGLPPSPICNPGYDSLFAAFHPTPSDFLYYITGQDGKMYYAKTLEQHNQNIAKYLR